LLPAYSYPVLGAQLVAAISLSAAVSMSVKYPLDSKEFASVCISLQTFVLL